MAIGGNYFIPSPTLAHQLKNLGMDLVVWLSKLARLDACEIPRAEKIKQLISVWLLDKGPAFVA